MRFCSAILAVALAVPAANAAVVFDFRFIDPEGTGFKAPGKLGADRRAGLRDAGARIASVLSAYTATIVIEAKGGLSGAILAIASGEKSADDGAGFTDRSDVMTKILLGDSADPEPNIADGNIIFNFAEGEDGVGWGYGDRFGSDKTDFVSSSMHELTHTLGFASSINKEGADPFQVPPGTPNKAIWAPYDKWVGDAAGPVIDPTTFALDGTRWARAVVGGSSATKGLFFHGPKSVAANGGKPVNLKSGTTFAPGSSISHLDDDYFTTTDLLMESSGGVGGVEARAYSAIELAMLQDIGYAMAAFPSGARPAPSRPDGSAALMTILQMVLE